MKKYYALCLMATAGLLPEPRKAEAHVKWFTDLEPEKETIANIMSPWFIALAIITAALLALLTQVLPVIDRWKLMNTVNDKLDRLRSYSLPILKYGLAAALLIQVLSGTVFVPEFKISSQLESILLWASIILLLIPHHWATKAGALAVLFLFGELTRGTGVFHMLDYGFYVAIVYALLVEKTKAAPTGLPFLYLGTGLSLCWVAVEKWVFPAMALDIVDKHGVPTFGFHPAHFIDMAAFIEFVVGYLLVVGILNRLLSLVLTGIFVSTTMLFGMTELFGHFMIHIILLIFIIEGVSFYKPPISMHKTKLDQMIFVSLNFVFVLSTFVLIYYRFA